MKVLVLSFAILLVVISTSASQQSWKLTQGQPSATTPISFKVALKQQNLNTLENLFWEISNPHSALYGKFLSHEQIADLISLPEDNLSEVEAYLRKDSGKVCNVELKRSLHRDYIHVNTCVGQAETMMPNLKLGLYRREDFKEPVLRSTVKLDIADNLHFLGIPSNLHEYLSGIHDITDLPVPPKNLSTTAPTPEPFDPWLPNVKELTITEIIKEFNVNMDGISDETLQLDDPQIRQAVVELEGWESSASNLAAFQRHFNIKENPIAKRIGKGTVSVNSSEADLDVQTLTAIAQGVQTWSFVFPPSATWVDIPETIMATEGAPRTISVSFGNLETIYGKSLVLAANVSLMKLGLSGMTWICGAGDSGPALNTTTCDSFDAEFPASSPYVLSVGGTKITKGSTTPAAWFRSGGGFSNFSKRPSFQEKAVQNYLSNVKLPPNPKGARYTTTGRAVPDVSAFAAFYQIYYQGALYGGGAGTSAATPQFAGILTLIQIHRHLKGLGPLGPVTQALYQLEDGVGFDVTEGQTYALSRISCTLDMYPGFFASKGWDPTTGLGNPNYDVLLEQLISLGENKEKNLE